MLTTKTRLSFLAGGSPLHGGPGIRCRIPFGFCAYFASRMVLRGKGAGCVLGRTPIPVARPSPAARKSPAFSTEPVLRGKQTAFPGTPSSTESMSESPTIPTDRHFSLPQPRFWIASGLPTTEELHGEAGI